MIIIITLSPVYFLPSEVASYWHCALIYISDMIGLKPIVTSLAEIFIMAVK